MRLLVQDLTPGQAYKIQLRATDGVSFSEWSQLIDLPTTTDAVAPSPVTGLAWAVEGTSFIATWTAPTTNSNGSALNDLRDYQVTLYSPANPSEKVFYYVPSTRFDFPFEVNSNAFSVPRAEVTIEVKARDTSGNLSSVVTATSANAAPASVTGLVVVGGQGNISATWTQVADTDLKGYEVYASQTGAGFTPGPGNLVGQTPANSFSFEANAGQTWYVKVRAVDIFGTGSTTYATGSATSKNITDGIAPTTSPTPTVIGQANGLYVRWAGITNADPVKYEVHISTTSGFTPNSGTKVGETGSTFQTIQALPGPEPLPGDPDARTIQYDMIYYVRIIAKDDDGAAPVGAQGSGQRVRITGPDIASETITGNNIVGGSFTGREFAGEVFVGNKFTSRQSEDSEGVEFGQDGFGVWRSNGMKKFYVPVSDDEDAFVDGEFIARGLTVTGGASFQSSENEITADSAMTLMRGITAPSAMPQFAITYESVRPSTESLTAAQRTNNDPNWGLGGPFHLVPSEVSHIDWRGNENLWIIAQVRPNGTRNWWFNPDGTPKDRYGNGVYFADLKDWECWSTTEMTTSSNPAKNGTYTIFRFIPGTGNDWYVSGPPGINKYTRLNPNGTPAVGNNGQDFFIAEVVGSSIKINYHTMTASGPLPAATTQHSSASGYATSLCCAIYNSTGSGGFDLVGGGATHRYATAERNVNYSARTIYQNGTGPNNLFPGNSGGWASSSVSAESWECPTTNRRGMMWNGTHFYTYGADGFLYKHEDSSTQWDPNAVSSRWWGQISFYDDFGTTHETKPGPIKDFIMRRRAKLLFTPPAIPDNGGADDPKKVRIYMGRGGSQPANGAMWLQGSVTTGFYVTTLATGTSNPPTLGNFPNTTPARIRNDDDTLVISGDGSILANLITTTNMKMGSEGIPIKHLRSGTVSNVGTNSQGQIFLTHGGSTPPSVLLITADTAHKLRVQSRAATQTTSALVVYAFGSAAFLASAASGITFEWTAIWL